MKIDKTPARVLELLKMLQPHMLVWLVGALVLVTLFRVLYWL